MKILIDTNIFLDFYRSSHHSLEILAEVNKNFDKIILTDQIIQEFERSRESVIKNVLDNFLKESQIDGLSSSFLQSLPEFKRFTQIQKEYKEIRKEISNKINSVLLDPSKDDISNAFKELVDSTFKGDAILYTTNEIFQKAQNRKMMGNPPYSNKYSIGDEINWEIILANIKEDIIIVGRDNTYNKNFDFLRKEYHKNTGHYIIALTNKITTAFQHLGISTSGKLIEEENKVLEGISEYWKYVDLSANS